MHQARPDGFALDVDPSRVEWRETSSPGVGWIPLYLASDAGGRSREEGDPPPEASVLIRMDAGCGYPRHRHLDVEEVLVLRGGYRDELGTYTCGDYVRYEAGSAHAPVALEGDTCVLFASARGGVRVED